MNAIRWVAGLLASLASVSCLSRTCDMSLRYNPTTVHENDITLSRPATIIAVQFCLDAKCRVAPLDTSTPGKKSCFPMNGGSSGGFCVTSMTADTLHIGGTLSTDEFIDPPSSVHLTITDSGSGAPLFDKKSPVSVHDYDDEGCHTTWNAEASL